mgnify:CR=1 FL=1
MITLGTRAIVELERYIRDTFTDCVNDCNICKRLCVRVGICLFTRGSPAGHTQELEKVGFGGCALDISEYRWQSHCADMVSISPSFRFSGCIEGTTLKITKIYATYNHYSCPLRYCWDNSLI